MYKLLFLSFLLLGVFVYGQGKPVILLFEVSEKIDTARYYYYYSPRFTELKIDDAVFDVWYTYVIDSTYYPGVERFEDNTYKRWKRDWRGRLMTVQRIAPKSMREIFITDTARFLPHWSGEIPAN